MRVTPPLAPRATKSVVASLLEREPTLIPRYNYQLPEPLRNCGVVWGGGEVTFTGEAGGWSLSLDDQWRAGVVQAEPKGPAQTDFFRLLTGAQGTHGHRHLGERQVRALPAARACLFIAAREPRRAGRSTFRIHRVRLGDEVLIVNAACLERLLGAAGGRGRRPEPAHLVARRRPRRPREVRRRARDRPEEADLAALAGQFGLTVRRPSRRRHGAIAAALAGCRDHAVEAGGGGRLRRRLLRHHARGGARLRRDRPHRRRRSRLPAGRRRRLHPAAAPGRHPSRRVQPALRPRGSPATPGGHGDFPTTGRATSSPPAPTSPAPTAPGRARVQPRRRLDGGAAQGQGDLRPGNGIMNPGKLCFGRRRAFGPRRKEA